MFRCAFNIDEFGRHCGSAKMTNDDDRQQTTQSGQHKVVYSVFGAGIFTVGNLPMKEKLNFRRLLLVTGLFIVLLAQGCGDLHNSATVIEVNTVDEFVTENRDAVILDVRRPTEYEESHIPGSVNVPVQVESFEELVAKLDPRKKYIVHCTSNHFIGRSSRALKSMQNLGFKHLYSLKGGYDAWRDAELPLTETVD